MTTQINGPTCQGKLFNGLANAINDLGKVIKKHGNAIVTQGTLLDNHGRQITDLWGVAGEHDRLFQNPVGNTSSSCFAALMCLISGVVVGTISYGVTTDCWQSSGFWQHVRCHSKYINPFSDVSNSARLLNTVPWIVAALSIGYLGNAVLNSIGLKEVMKKNFAAQQEKIFRQDEELYALRKEQAAQDKAQAAQAKAQQAAQAKAQADLFAVIQKQDARIQAQENRGCYIQ